MTADDLLARIDGATEQWDTWDGRSADAARWGPDETTHHDVTLAACRDALDVWLDHLHVAFARVADAIHPAVEAMAEIQQAQQQRAKHQPPMWAVQPNRERRR